MYLSHTNEYQRKYMREYQKRLEVKERMREYRKRPGILERNQDNTRRYRERIKGTKRDEIQRKQHTKSKTERYRHDANY